MRTFLSHQSHHKPQQQSPTMSSQLTSQDAAAKHRIITHMNADHQDSLIRYLEYYAGLSSFSARNAQLTDITFDSLTIEYSHEQAHRIPIKPPMTVWSEARPKAVEMDTVATRGLGRGSVTVKRYKEPRGWMTAVMAVVVVTALAFSRRANFEPGSILFWAVLQYTPSFANFCWMVQPLVIPLIIVIHGTELWHFERSRLRRHTVRVFSRTWWEWAVSNLVEGFGAFVRFDEVVREEEEKKAKAKH